METDSLSVVIISTGDLRSRSGELKFRDAMVNHRYTITISITRSHGSRHFTYIIIMDEVSK